MGKLFLFFLTKCPIKFSDILGYYNFMSAQMFQHRVSGDPWARPIPLRPLQPIPFTSARAWLENGKVATGRASGEKRPVADI